MEMGTIVRAGTPEHLTQIYEHAEIMPDSITGDLSLYTRYGVHDLRPSMCAHAVHWVGLLLMQQKIIPGREVQARNRPC